jgi:hypothetical protein
MYSIVMAPSLEAIGRLIWVPENDDAPENAAEGEAISRTPVAIAATDFIVLIVLFVVVL